MTETTENKNVKRRGFLQTMIVSMAALTGLQISKSNRQSSADQKTADQKKKDLLELAKNGTHRPSSKTKLGKALSKYVRPATSYDPEFDRAIRKLKPDWFKNC